MSYSKLAVRGALWSLLQVLAERLTQTVVMLTAALFLGPHDFGVAAMATAPALIAASTLQTGNQLIVQRDEATQHFLDTAFWLFLLLGAACAVFVVGLALVFRAMPGYETVWLMILPTALAQLLAAVGVVPEGLLMRTFAYRVLAIRKTVGQAIAGVACCGLAVYGFGAWSIVVQVTVAPIISTAISLIAAKWRPRGVATFREMGSLTRFSGALLGWSMLNQVNVRSVDLVVGLIAGPTATGVFRLARTVLDLATSLFMNPINGILLPIFSRMVGDRERTLEAMWQACGVASVIAPVSFLGSAFASPFVSAVIFSNKWPHLSETVTLFLLSLPSVAVMVPVQTYLVASGRPKLPFFNNLYQTVANVIMVALGAWFGIIWAAGMFSLRCLLGAAALLVVLKRVSPDIRMTNQAAATTVPLLVAVGIAVALHGVVWMLHLDLAKLVPALIMTTVAMLIYAGVSLVMFRAWIDFVIRAIRKR